MTLHLGDVPAGSTLYIPFTTYDKTNGASVTMTGLAVTDIGIYKNGSTTQRASDAGYALLDTDGIDFDGITGLHGFSVNLSDNTDAGFYVVGAQYWVVVSTITIDSQTVTFIPATFRIVAAEATAGYPKSDTQETIEANHLDHLLAADYDPASKPGVATALLNELIESDAGVSRYTANALEQGPTGSGTTPQQVWEYATRALTDKANFTLTSGYDPAKTAAQAGDEMDLVDAPNATAVAIFQLGLSTPADIQALLTQHIDGTLTFGQALAVMVARLAGPTSGGGTATILFKDPTGTYTRISMPITSAFDDRGVPTFSFTGV